MLLSSVEKIVNCVVVPFRFSCIKALIKFRTDINVSKLSIHTSVAFLSVVDIDYDRVFSGEALAYVFYEVSI